MPKNYFPDTNVLVFYLGEYNKTEYDQAKKIISLTGPNGSLEGFIVDSVDIEFEGITRDKRLNEATSLAIKFLNDLGSRGNLVKLTATRF